MSDFTSIIEISGTFTTVELDSGVDFTPTGDQGQIIVTNVGFGEGGFGEGGFGGDTETLVLNGPVTTWTNIETP